MMKHMSPTSSECLAGVTLDPPGAARGLQPEFQEPLEKHVEEVSHGRISAERIE